MWDIVTSLFAEYLTYALILLVGWVFFWFVLCALAMIFEVIMEPFRFMFGRRHVDPETVGWRGFKNAYRQKCAELDYLAELKRNSATPTSK